MTVVRLAETDAHEGPVYVPEEDALYFTSVPRPSADGPVVDIRRLGPGGDETVVRRNANVANGMALDARGRLIVCEQGTMRERARIVRVDRRTGASETVVDHWQGLPLNSPNDVVVAADGAIWFTDPSYGFLQGFRPAPGERVLYVGDSEAGRVEAFDVIEGHRLDGRRLLATTDGPDGLAVDAAGNVYVSAPDGIAVFTPGGEQIGEIAIPGAVNFTWGGAERGVLYVTADTAIWAAVPAIHPQQETRVPCS